MIKIRVFVMMAILVLIVPIIAGCVKGTSDLGPGTYQEGTSFTPGEKIDTKTFDSVEEYNTFIKITIMVDVVRM